MEDFLMGMKNGAIVAFGIMAFIVLFHIWLIPTVIANKKGMDQSTKIVIWALIILSIFCPLIWLVALMVAYFCDR